MVAEPHLDRRAASDLQARLRSGQFVVTADFLVQSGIEPIFQMTCRDRNRLALQGDLLGALSLGIRNVLVLGGDDPKAGDQPEAKAVYDLDSRGLLAMANAMREEKKLPS